MQSAHLPVSAEDQAFLAELRQFLATALTDPQRAAARCGLQGDDHLAQALAWHRQLARRGWSVPHWPLQHGGCGWTAQRQYLFAQQLAQADAPPLPRAGTHRVAPLLMAFGTPAQQRQWLPGIRSGDEHWVQALPARPPSPAELGCQAWRDGAHHVLSGHLRLDRQARLAQWLLLPVGHDPGPPGDGGGGAEGAGGFSAIALDLRSPGVRLRPWPVAGAEPGLLQLQLDEVRVPVAGLIGEVRGGDRLLRWLRRHPDRQPWAPPLWARWRQLRQAAGCGPAQPGRPRPLQLAELAWRIDALQALEWAALQSPDPSAGAAGRQRLATRIDLALAHAALQAAPAGMAYLSAYAASLRAAGHGL